MSKQEEYLFSDMFLDRERLVLQTEIFMPAFLGKIAYIFKNYGLEERVRAARGAGKQIRIVDIGCGEGLYLQELADWLQKRGWQENCELIGTDSDKKAISTAIEWARVCQKNYLQFYVHDITTPLARPGEGGPGVNGSEAKFDLIYDVALLEHVPDPYQSLSYMCEALKPGGVLMNRVVVGSKEDRYLYFPHPSFKILMGAALDYFDTISQGNAGLKIQSYLQRLGMDRIEIIDEKMVIGGTSEEGRQMLRNTLEGFRNARRTLVSRDYLTEEDFDRHMKNLETEVSPKDEGYTYVRYAIAAKPLASPAR